MSRTIFWYIFRDLLRIFLLTSFALAGIMSFGGLLRPLTDQGLDAGQVGRVLLYFMPAMMTYSLPIAAIFATTMVYGRLSADNELIACRGAGIDHFSIALPAVVLGLVVAIVSLVFLCFVVPVFTLKVERVVYQNLAQLVANNIERTHEMPFDNMTIFASAAQVAQRPDPNEQAVVLAGPMITTYYIDRARARKGERPPRIPERFYMAQKATVYITRAPETEEISIEAILDGGIGFPRELAGAAQGGVETARFGPYPVESPIKENTKFMDIFQLKDLFLYPARSKRINTQRMTLVRYEQETALLGRMRDRLLREGELTLASADAAGEVQFRVSGTGAADAQVVGEELVVKGGGGERSLRFEHAELGVRGTSEAREVRLRAQADNDRDRMIVTIRLTDPVVRTGGQALPQNAISRRIAIAMPETIRAIRQRPADYYAAHPSVPPEPRQALAKALGLMRNEIQSEMHGRASFAISCLILVMIGCSLGMMFRSGNFLSAFAVSAVPAILIITLIIAGQQVADNPSVRDGLSMGLSLIWAGNAVVAMVALFLMARLQRQ